MILDAVSPLERVRISGQILANTSALNGANALEKVKISGRIAALLAQLGEASPKHLAAPEHFASFEPQKDGSLIIRGDTEALMKIAHSMMVKPKAIEGGIRLTKGDARHGAGFPERIVSLPSGARLEYLQDGAVGVRGDFRGGYLGAAESLQKLEHYFAEDLGPKEFARVFGKSATDQSVADHEQEQAEIAARKEQIEADASQKRLAHARLSGMVGGLSAAERETFDREKSARDEQQRIAEDKSYQEWLETIGKGDVQNGNERYKAFVDTLSIEEIQGLGPTMLNVEYMAWVGARLAEYKATGAGQMPYANGAARDAWQEEASAWIRAWADKRLADRTIPASITEPEIIEHTTGRGKVIRGIVRTDITYAEAKAIDEYTFRKDGGFFIREKHLAGFDPAESKLQRERRDPEDPEAELQRLERESQRKADALANELAKQEERRAQQVAKLRDVAASTLEKAEQELSRDRLANTSRRASMAASGLAAAEASRAIAKTMQNLADAIERGQAQHLAGITSRAAVQSLQDFLRQAMYEADRGLSYSEQQRQKGRPPTLADIQFAKFPVPKWGTAGTSASAVLEAIKGKRGSVELANKIRYSVGPDAEMISALKAMIGDKETNYQIGWWNLEQVAKVARLKRAGITNDQELRDALAEFLEFREVARAEDPIAKAERAILGQKVGVDFFPTPKALGARMAQMARIGKGDRVLEPSAGNGNLADAAKSVGGEVSVIEISSQLRDILEAKGYDVVAHDFMSYTPDEPFDAVIMNPPFSNRLDAEHIQRAFGMLKPGGRLVAIAGEGVFFGTDGKAVAFRKWLDTHGAEVEALAQGTFMDKNLLATTGANARLITIVK